MQWVDTDLNQTWKNHLTIFVGIILQNLEKEIRETKFVLKCLSWLKESAVKVLALNDKQVIFNDFFKQDKHNFVFFVHKPHPLCPITNINDLPYECLMMMWTNYATDLLSCLQQKTIPNPVNSILKHTLLPNWVEVNGALLKTKVMHLKLIYIRKFEFCTI